ncbi:MAG TPA: DISARM system helicase DrmA [Myxococcaceae bacterium]
MPAPPDSTAVRGHLVEALEADLIGPFAGSTHHATAEEVLELPPSRWYVTGFLVPEEAPEPEDAEADGELGSGDDEDDDAPEAKADEAPRIRPQLPRSLGLSVILPRGDGGTITATVEWADYVAFEVPPPADAPQTRPLRHWRRVPRPPAAVMVPLEPARLSKGVPVGGSRGLWLQGKLEILPNLRPEDAGIRGLSLFVVNRRPPGDPSRKDEQYAFQVRLTLAFEPGFYARPNLRDEKVRSWDERLADLHFRKCFEYAVGHNASAETLPGERPGAVTKVRTCWLPRATVRKVKTHEVEGVTTAMEALGELSSADVVRGALGGISAAYLEWIDRQRQEDPGTPERRVTQKIVLDKARDAAVRIRAGVELLASDADVLEAFRIANQAMAMAARRRRPGAYGPGQAPPQWRLFQLAFMLMNLPAISGASPEDREAVDLIFFPTGGGKTEAYLGVIAVLLVLRRLRGRTTAGGGLGVAVLLRYTLRLLTLDQLGRAATLICALETMRRKDRRRLGDERFAIGLWVGKSGSPNTLRQASEAITAYKAKTGPSPFPLTECPWCLQDGSLGPNSFEVRGHKTNPADIGVRCLRPGCDFEAAANLDGLPVLFVDEQIYREVPAFVVATVDKFAMLPWRGEAGMLFGRVVAREGRRFYGPFDGADVPRTALRLPAGVRPPDLVVQDELHLISGPLGTMVGLYEGAIDVLAGRPKIIAATATVRRAAEQIQALFERRDVRVFPPPGIDDSETFFATVDRESEGRLYVGAAAPGRAMKALLIRVYVALLAGAERDYDRRGPSKQPADPYMTLVGYFNSLRELGGMRRLVEDEVRKRAYNAEYRIPSGWKDRHPWASARPLNSLIAELTSRLSSDGIKDVKRKIESHWSEGKVDVLLASNMISVGVDIDRLGLMVVAGQPKTTSEYIQASSRVGRDPERPGLVVAVYNAFKPRDRSHYERFEGYHQSFYRYVEATTVTPFSGPALDRGLAGALVGLVRHGVKELNPADAVMDLADHRERANALVEQIARRAGAFRSLERSELAALEQSIRDRCHNILDAWDRIVTMAREEDAASRRYSPWDPGSRGKELLSQVTDDLSDRSTDERKFSAPTSMRDVEPSAQLWLERQPLGGRPVGH